jgi:hypothetical protein
VETCVNCGRKDLTVQAVWILDRHKMRLCAACKKKLESEKEGVY